MVKLDSKQEGTFAIIAALVVLFSSMWDPQVSIVVAVAALALFSIYKFMQK
jgi:hypothetical protein